MDARRSPPPSPARVPRAGRRSLGLCCFEEGDGDVGARTHTRPRSGAARGPGTPHAACLTARPLTTAERQRRPGGLEGLPGHRTPRRDAHAVGLRGGAPRPADQQRGRFAAGGARRLAGNGATCRLLPGDPSDVGFCAQTVNYQPPKKVKTIVVLEFSPPMLLCLPKLPWDGWGTRQSTPILHIFWLA